MVKKIESHNTRIRKFNIDNIEQEWDIDKPLCENQSTKLDIIRETRDRKRRF